MILFIGTIAFSGGVMRDKFTKTNIKLALVALLLVVLLAVPVAFYSFGKDNGQGTIIDNTAPSAAGVGTRIENEAQLKAWLIGDELDGYLAPPGDVDNAGFTINFTHDANYILKSGRTLDGRGYHIALRTDTRVNSTVAMNVMGVTVAARANGTTDVSGVNTGRSDVGKLDECFITGAQGRHSRYHYGTFLHHIEEGAYLKDINFHYITEMNYVFNADRATLNQGIVAGRNEGSMLRINLDIRAMFYHNDLNPQPHNTVMVGGLAGYNSGTIRDCKVSFGAKYGPSPSGGALIAEVVSINTSSQSRIYTGGLAGYNIGRMTNNTVVFENVAYGYNTAAIAGSTAEGGMTANGGAVGRNGFNGIIDGVYIDVQKPVKNLHGQIIDGVAHSGGGYNSEALFVGLVDRNTLGIKITNMYVTSSQTEPIYGCYEGVSSGAYRSLQLSLSGAKVEFDQSDSSGRSIKFSVPNGSSGTTILWSAAGQNIYDQSLTSIVYLKTDIKSSMVFTTGTIVKIPAQTVPTDITMEYGNLHSFHWGNIFGTIPKYNPVNLKVKNVYVDNFTHEQYFYPEGSRIDVGSYKFSILKNVPAATEAYLDVANKVVALYTDIEKYALRENIIVKPKLVDVIWTGLNTVFTYDGTDQTGKITASYFDINNKKIALPIVVADGGKFFDYRVEGYNIETSFKTRNYKTSDILTHHCVMNKAKYNIAPDALSLEPYIGDYDGKEHKLQLKLKGSSLTNVDEILAAFLGADKTPLVPIWEGGNSMTDVGNKTVIFDLISNNDNYETLVFSELQSVLNIKPKKVDIVWAGSDLVYNGEDQKSKIAATYTDVFGKPANYDLTINAEDGEFRNYRTEGYTFNASLSSEIGNYIVIPAAVTEKTYHITKIQLDMSKVIWSSETGAIPYTGQPIFRTLTGLAEGVQVDYTSIALEGSELTGGMPVNVGRYKVHALITLNVNVEVNVAGELEREAEYSIDPIDYDYSKVLFADQNIPYTSTAHVITYDATLVPVGFDGTSPTFAVSENSFTNLTDEGEVVLTFTAAGSKNYKAGVKEFRAIIKIVPARVDAVWSGIDITYDGTDHIAGISASYTDVNGNVIALVVQNIGVANVINYNADGYYFYCIMEDANYLFKDDALVTNAQGEAFKVVMVKKAPIELSAANIIVDQTKNSINIKLADGIEGSIVLNSGEVGAAGEYLGLVELTTYVFTINRIAVGAQTGNYCDSLPLSFEVTTKYRTNDYTVYRDTIGEITYESRVVLEELHRIYNNLNQLDMVANKADFDTYMSKFDAIINGINADVEDNTNVGNAANTPVAAAAIATAFSIVAFAGVVMSKFGRSL